MVKVKDLVISCLTEQISQMETQNPVKDFLVNDSVDEDVNTSGSISTESENEATTSQLKSQCLQYHCDCCGFKTLHEVGLKIHKIKSHKNKCEVCDMHFANKEQLERHMLSCSHK